MPKTKKPETEEKPAEIENLKNEKKSKKLSEAEFEQKVIELSKKGFTSEKIGQELKNSGIHTKDYNKKISTILKEKKTYTNPDLKNTEEKLENLKKHYEKNKQDKRAKREVDRIASKVRKIKLYLGLVKKKK